MTPYDEGKHRRSLGLAPLHEVDTQTTVEAPLDLVGPLDDHASLLDNAKTDVRDDDTSGL